MWYNLAMETMEMKRKRGVALCALICLALVLPGCGPGAAKPKMTMEEAHALYHDAVDKLFASEQIALDYYISVVEEDPPAGEAPEVMVDATIRFEWIDTAGGVEMRMATKAVLPDGGYEDIATTWYKDGVMRTIAYGEIREGQEQICTFEEWLQLQRTTLCRFSIDATDSYTVDQSGDNTMLTFDMGHNGTVSGASGESSDASEFENMQVTASVDADGWLIDLTFIIVFYENNKLYLQTVTANNIRYSGVVVDLPEGFPNDGGGTQPYTVEENPTPTLFDFATFPKGEFPHGAWTVNKLEKTYGVPQDVYAGYASQSENAAVVLSYGNKSFISEPISADRFSFYESSLEDGRYDLNESDKALEFNIPSIAIYHAELELPPYSIEIGESTKAQIIEAYGEAPAYLYRGPGEARYAGEDGIERVVSELNYIFYLYAILTDGGTLPGSQAENNSGIISYEFD